VEADGLQEKDVDEAVDDDLRPGAVFRRRMVVCSVDDCGSSARM